MTAAPNRWTPDAYTLLREMHGPASVDRVARARGEIVYHCMECRALHNVVSSEGAQGGRSDGYCAPCFASMEARWRIEDAQLEEVVPANLWGGRRVIGLDVPDDELIDRRKRRNRTGRGGNGAE